MRKTLPVILLAAASLACAVPGCKSGTDQTGAKPEQGAAQGADAGPRMVALRLEAYGLPLVMSSPDEVTASKVDDFVQVKTGDGLLMEVHQGAVDMAVRKAAIARNEVDKLDKYLVDDANIIVYQMTVTGQPEVHFIAAIKADGADYYCENVPGPRLDKEQVERLVALCQSASTKQESQQDAPRE